MDDNNFYAAPTAAVDDMYARQAWSEQGVLAERGTRLGAALLDGVPVGIIGIVAAIMVPAMITDDGGANMVMVTIGGAVIGLALIALMVVNLYLLHENGQTIGKKIL